MASSEKKLLDAIYASPDDDAPRLVHADALIERGEPRGEFIQLQCELARVDESDDRWYRMKHRERALLKKHKEAWTKELCALGDDLDVDFIRGFPEIVRGPAATLATLSGKLLNAMPLLSHIDATFAFQRALTLFLESPLFAKARSVRITSGRRRLSLAALNDLTKPIALRRLELDEVNVSRDDVEAVARCRAFVNLRELELNRCLFGKDSPAPLEQLEAPLTRFATLTGKFPEAFVRALSMGPAFTHLSALGLCNTHIGDAGLDELIRTRRLPSVEELDLRSNSLSKAGVSKLLDNVRTQGLKQLLLGGNELNDDIVARIATWSGASELRRLDLGSDKIGDKGVLAIAASPHLGNLRSLVLTMSTAGEKAKAKLIASPHLKNARLYVGDRFLKHSD